MHCSSDHILNELPFALIAQLVEMLSAFLCNRVPGRPFVIDVMESNSAFCFRGAAAVLHASGVDLLRIFLGELCAIDLADIFRQVVPIRAGALQSALESCDSTQYFAVSIRS